MRISDWSSDVCSSDLPAVAEPRVEHRREAWEGVHHRQYPDLAARCQLVVHEVHGPDIVRPDGLGATLAQLGLDPPLRGLVPQLHAQLPLIPVGLLQTDRPALRSEEHTSELQSLMSISYAVFCL